MEDIVAVLDGRSEVVDEVGRSAAPLRQFLREAFASFLGQKAFMEGISGHLPPDAANQARAPLVLQRARDIAMKTP